MNLEQTLNEITGKMYGKNIGACTDAQLYTGVLQLTKEKMAETPVITGDKKVYYISMEFLIGKLLSNNLINLGIYEELSDILKKNGKNLADIEEAEPEPSLGNGGLGRLAACFLDSIATLGLPGDGIGLNYHFGLFKQVFKDHLQNAEKNDWIQKDSWLNNTGTKFEVAFGDRKVTSVLYDIDVVSHTCAYTNHTILAEALEKWPLAYIEKVVPQLVPIIKELSNRVAKKYKDEKVQIIDKDKRVHMAHIDIHYGYSVNGVAAIHTEILKQSELNHFYKIYPEKFNNKTNGITFRRWLLSCNHELAAFLSQTIGDGYKKDADELQKLLEHKEDQAVLDAIYDIKKTKKTELVSYIKDKEGVELNPDSIFDIQVKRLHEYKRQQMNALYIIHKYLEIKGGKKPSTPLTFIFGAKAAPAYVIAQDIIHLLLVMSDIINNDPEVSPYMKLVMVENYNVSYAEKLIPACDISEQISLASKEASGTGNMKFMLNGAVTLGTSDGANVEIHELVGDDNIYIFGQDSDTVIKHYEKADYVSKDYYKKSSVIKEAVDFIVSKEVLKVGKKENLERLYNELLNKDWFMTLLDLEDYIKVKDQAFADYEDQQKWKKMMLVNIAKAGFFSSDRTIAEYNRDIWKLK